MSAIVGRLHLSEAPVDPRIIAASLDALADYGPAGATHWTEGPVGLGYRHLETTPESRHEAQPLAQDGLVIVSDAIIDNRDTLCDQLGIARCARSSTPDSRIVLAAFQRWGHECLSRLAGDFAFVIWDARTRTLFGARDHIGARPLYFCHSQGRFLFATDVRGLLAHRDLAFAIDEQRVASFLIWPLNPQETSFFANIHPVMPGHWFAVNRNGLEQRPYWRPREAPDIRYTRRQEYHEHFRELLDTAVAARLRTRFPVGAHISGGLDSTGVTILASRLLQAQGRTLDMSYTWAPPVSDRYPLSENSRDERRIIRGVCEREQIACHHAIATGADYCVFLARDMAVEGHCDLFEELPVMTAAARRGTRILLSGWGGDEVSTFGTRGYPAYLLKRGHWLRLVAMARKRAGGLRHLRRLARFLWLEAWLPLMPNAIYAHWSPYVRTDRLSLLARREFLERFNRVRYERGPAWREYADPRDVQIALLENGHLASRMSSWSSWSAPHGLIYRYPLTDRRLLDFTLGLPRELLWQKGVTRGVYRHALQDVLPPQLGKADPVNERKRLDQLVACRRLLALQARHGVFRRPCPWLDTHALNERLLERPHHSDGENPLSFVPLESALRVWHLWQRYGDSSGKMSKPG
ncbi:asparagine synthase-related protein [Halomonas heilongjiangensis]|uniref:asparagine synthase (glutamine-hydrolyzing) n=1 Tax=Halomonas heilongjiangensis TaxID=1387883 RepID=A0A2N7TUM0_9GAMM|nr:asparagine synthase-related protein [Halomonas heilongjiangensis]PMR71877.1 hypothetical protein C1H66_01140 [Halomonas heilongjiangensis]PXX87659.1 hypothetical protein CR158_17810 [Halomonas heilongjiangensis]